MAVIEAYVTNLGKYNEGELASALLKFPTTREAVQEVLKQIGIDNIRYEEIFIADYDGDLSELNACLGEYESIDELNHLACLLSELDKSDLEKFEAVVASGEHTSGAGDLINLAENLDCYDLPSTRCGISAPPARWAATAGATVTPWSSAAKKSICFLSGWIRCFRGGWAAGSSRKPCKTGGRPPWQKTITSTPPSTSKAFTPAWSASAASWTPSPPT